MVRTAILSVRPSPPHDPTAAGEHDGVVQALRQVLKGGPFVEVDYQQVPDEQALIRAKLRVWCDQGNIDLVLTTGGIGLGQRDRTPEATAEVIERHVPGVPEALRAAFRDDQPLAALYRSLAGVRRGTLIVNLPGTPGSAAKGLAAVVTALAFAVEEIRGDALAEGSKPSAVGLEPSGNGLRPPT